MGGFFYTPKEAGADIGEILSQSRSQFERSGFAAPLTFETDSYVVDYYSKIDYPAKNHVAFDNGDFVFAVGTFVYKGRIGAEALTLLYGEADPQAAMASARGHFAVVMRKGTHTQLLKDPIGSYDLFLTRGGSCLTTSFLAAARVARTRTINVQQVYEYVFTGVSLGPTTPFDEIRRLPLEDRMILEPAPAIVHGAPHICSAERKAPVAELAERNLQGLLDYTTTLANIFGDNIKVALSGGYDSRFLIALFRRSGVTPRLFVYGSENDKDVRMAKRISEAEGMALQHVDKALLRHVTPDDYAQTVERNFHREDALPNGGVFTNGAELLAREDRNAGGALHVNGGGGEVFRNFFNLLERRLTPQQFVWVFYSRFDPAECTERFRAPAYTDAIASKVATLFPDRHTSLSRREVECLYPYFRCRSWFGRENSVNSRWGHSVLPFFDHQTATEALRVPIAYKHFGNFESRLIRMADPRLARQPSNYGHDFTRDAPFAAAAKGYATYLRPAWLRQYTFRLKSLAAKRHPRPPLLTQPYLERVLDTAFPHMSPFFHVNAVKSDLQFARICTLEYLFQKLADR